MPHPIELSYQRLQAVGVLHYPGFLVLSVFLAALVGAYIHLFPPHKRLWTRNRYRMPPGSRGRPIVGSLVSWLSARNGGKIVPWVRITLLSSYRIYGLRVLN